MKRKIGNLLLIGSLSLLASCGEINGGTSIAKPSVAPSTSTTPKPNENVTFSATLNLNGNPFYLTDPEHHLHNPVFHHFQARLQFSFPLLQNCFASLNKVLNQIQLPSGSPGSDVNEYS